MRLLSIYIGDLTQVTESGELKDLCFLSDLKHASYFNRSHLAEGLLFTSALMAQRTPRGQRAIIEDVEKGYRFITHAYEKHAVTLAMDLDYPRLTAQFLLSQIEEVWYLYEENPKLSDLREKLGEFLIQYQDPKQVDKLIKLKETLDEVKKVMFDNIETVLQRGEKIETLVSKSEKLSQGSKIFIKRTKSLNRCC